MFLWLANSSRNNLCATNSICCWSTFKSVRLYFQTFLKFIHVKSFGTIYWAITMFYPHNLLQASLPSHQLSRIWIDKLALLRSLILYNFVISASTFHLLSFSIDLFNLRTHVHSVHEWSKKVLLSPL